jgi:phosphoglycerate kinase
MMFDKKTIREVDVQSRRALVRVDFNVPLTDGKVADATRIRAALPTIELLLEQGAMIILCSHLGRPKGTVDPGLSMKPVADRLEELLGQQVFFVTECVGPIAESAAKNLQAGQVLLLENTRFQPGETSNDPGMAADLGRLAEIYVNDAFGSAHRAHASTEGVAHVLPAVAGLLLEKELLYFSRVLEKPSRPFAAILGGAKISDKIGVVRSLLKRADLLLFGGGMANTFLAAQGIEMGASLVEDSALATAAQILEGGQSKIRLPIDVVVAEEFDNHAAMRIVSIQEVPAAWRVLDIGPRTIAAYSADLRDSELIVWNGPMGVFEFPNFAQGTFAIAHIVAESDATVVIGGGDSAAAIKQAGVSSKVDHISTGGGASLQLLEGKELPGVAALQDREA